MSNILDNNELPLYSIGSAARILNISVHTLRMYERAGLILPFKKESKHRLYSESDIQRLKCIRSAINDKKISIAGIKTIYSLIPCWEITKCSEEERNNCEAYKSHSKPCWTFEHNGNKCSKIDCRNCEVYKKFSDCEKVKDLLIKILV
jgi:MerR family transcriptional regulator, heat shock protein HspR